MSEDLQAGGDLASDNRFSGRPADFIVMLLDGAMVAVSAAIQHSQAKRAAQRLESVHKAIEIVESGLRPALVAPERASEQLSLDTLYEYISARLAIAGQKDQVRILEEIYELLKGLRNAWKMSA